MLDVHPPHTSPHSWKEFFIHIVTIVIGLIIAVGIEQLVEAVHHHHQRVRLEEEMKAETEINNQRTIVNLHHVNQDLAWLELLRAQVDRMRDGGDRNSFVYPPTFHGFPGDPDTIDRRLFLEETWTTAKQNGTVDLLPNETAQFYNLFYRAKDGFTESFVDMTVAWEKMHAFELPFERGVDYGIPDVSRMTPEQLDAYAALIADTIVKANVCKRYMRIQMAFIESARGSLTKPDVPRFFREHPEPLPPFDPTPVE